MKRAKVSLPLGFAALAVFFAHADGAAPRPVDVVVDFTPEGRRLAHPTAQHPAYYYPVMQQFEQDGFQISGERAPPPNDVAHVLAAELAKQGYFVRDASHRPTLLLSIHYGCANPVIANFDPAGAASPPAMGGGRPPMESTLYMNEGQMLNILGGQTLRNLDLGYEREEVQHEALQNHYFVMVSAFDFAAYARSREKRLLWQAKMSVESDGIPQFGDALDALVKAGGPFFGRETKRPQFLRRPITPEGQVELGTPVPVEPPDRPPTATDR